MTFAFSAFDHAGSLDDLGQALESCTLDSARVLGRLATGFHDLEGPMSRLSQVQHGQIQGLRADLSAIAARLQQVADCLTAAAAEAQGLERATRATRAGIAAMRRKAALMHFAALNARIVATSMPRSDKRSQLFAVSAEEIISGIDQLLSRAEAEAGAVQKQIAEFGTAGLDATVAAIARTVATLRRVDSALADVIGQADPLTGETLGQALAAFGENISVSIMALQVGDSVRQRIDHVGRIQALHATDPNPHLQALAALQVRAAADAFRTDAETAMHALEAAAAAGRRLASGRRKGDGSSEDRYRAIETALLDARVLVDTLHPLSDDLLSRIDAMQRQFSGLNDLLSGMSSGERQIRLLGLNAVIACAGKGQEGRALNEAANQLATYARENTHDFQAVRTILETEVRDRTQALLAMIRPLPAILSDAVENGAAAMVATISRIVAERAQVGGGIDTLIRSVEGDLTRTRQGLGAVIDRITRVAAGWPPAAEARTIPFPAAEAVYALYSTDAEREIHRTYCAARGLTPRRRLAPVHAAPAAPAKDTTDPLDGILF